jgi:predicted phosphate transport protein (TIGR00153 family)
MGGSFAIRGRSTAGSFAARRLGGRFAAMVGGSPDYGELHTLLQDAGRNVRLATELLGELMRSWPDGAEKCQDLVDLEHKNDVVTHDIVHHLHARLAVPFERSDVLALASSLDDIVDYAEEVADFLALYRVEAPMDQAIELTDVLSTAGGVVALALDSLDDPGSAIPHLTELDRLEHEGDRILREGLTALFDVGVDPMVVIRWKDIFERVEQAIDACDHVAHILRGIAVKST